VWGSPEVASRRAALALLAHGAGGSANGEASTVGARGVSGLLAVTPARAYMSSTSDMMWEWMRQNSFESYGSAIC
jgi:hypothetical protein